MFSCFRSAEEVQLRLKDRRSLKGDRSYHTQNDVIRNIEVNVTRPCQWRSTSDGARRCRRGSTASKCTLVRLMHVYLEELKCSPFPVRHALSK